MVQMAKLWPAPAPTWSEVVRNRCKMILITFRYHPILWKFALKRIPGAGGAPDLPLDVGGHISDGRWWISKFLLFFHLFDLPEHMESGLVDEQIFANLKSHLAARWQLKHGHLLFFTITPCEISEPLIYCVIGPIYYSSPMKGQSWHARLLLRRLEILKLEFKIQNMLTNIVNCCGKF